jgi:exopolysaccharide biosynthesis polyprenyl glycosylphosphotransferase
MAYTGKSKDATGRTAHALRAGADSQARWAAAVDAGALLLAAATAARWANIRSVLTPEAVALVAVCVSCAATAHILRRRAVTALSELIVFSGFIAALAAASGMLFGAELGARETAMRAWVACMACLALARFAAGIVARWRSASRAAANATADRRRRATIIVGPAATSRLAAERLRRDRRLRIEPVGLLTDSPSAALGDPPADDWPPIVGRPEHIADIVTATEADQVLIAFPSEDDERLADVVHACWELRVAVLVLAPLFDLRSRATRVGTVGHLPLFALALPGADCWQLRAKYALDRLTAGVALLVLAPFLLATAAAIRLTMGAPVLFRQERVGERGRIFTLLKFRTMITSPQAAGEADAGWASSILGETKPGGSEQRAAGSAEPRCTALGAWLRRTSLDELPQLINVVRGEMSLVGPRPERTHYVVRFVEAIDRYGDRHRMRCGLTGWAQINGFRGETSLQDRVAHDNYYIENWSPWLDFRILWRTLPAIARTPEDASAVAVEDDHAATAVRRRLTARSPQPRPAAPHAAPGRTTASGRSPRSRPARART